MGYVPIVERSNIPTLMHFDESCGNLPQSKARNYRDYVAPISLIIVQIPPTTTQISALKVPCDSGK